MAASEHNSERWQSFLRDGPLSGGNLRAAVLGVNDGLLSNFGLVMGVAGGSDNPTHVMLTGIAGLLAGGFSMAAGEYISVSGQRDVYRHQIREEAVRLEQSPADSERALTEIYEDKGLTPEESRVVARRIMSDPRVALDTKVREELGLDPRFLGSPLGAASSSFVAFVLGAIVPIIPYLANADAFGLGVAVSAAAMSALLSAFALAAVGGMVALGSGRSPAWGALKMLMVGSLAASVTFAVGRLIGVAVFG